MFVVQALFECGRLTEYKTQEDGNHSYLARPAFSEEVADHARFALDLCKKVFLASHLTILPVPPLRPLLLPLRHRLHLVKPLPAQLLQLILAQVVKLVQLCVHLILRMAGSLEQVSLQGMLHDSLHSY